MFKPTAMLLLLGAVKPNDFFGADPAEDPLADSAVGASLKDAIKPI